MSRPALSWVAAAFFLLLALVLMPIGIPGLSGGTWEDREQSLAKLEGTLSSGASFHLPLPPPAFPKPSSYCAQCHPLPPHPGSGVSPAFLNQHSTHFDCLVCHWAAVAGPQPGPAWQGGALRQPLASAGEAGSGDVSSLRERVVEKQRCFDRGAGCGTCHRRGGMERFARPGLAPQARASLERLPDFFTLSGSTKWYFPQRLQTVAP